MSDTLILGGISFDGFSTPSGMGAGGKQAMVIHKLPGGARVIDTLGPDDDPISWNGFFFGNDALDRALALDAMRMSGRVQALTFAGQFRSVIVESYSYKIRRFPVWVEYNVSCVVYQNPAAGILGVSIGGVDALITSDLSFAMGLL